MAKSIAGLAAAVGMLLCGGVAHGFSGTAVGSWTNVVSADPFDVFTVANDDLGGLATFTWGVGGASPLTPFTNQFAFDGAGSDGGSWTSLSEDPFRIGSFSYRNGSTLNSIGIQGVDLNILLTVTDPLQSANTYSFDFSITNTPNTTRDPVLDGDIVTVAGAFSPTTFSFGGTTYTLQLLGFSNDAGGTIRTDFSSPEGSTAGADVYARITSRISPVPEPGTLPLCGIGLGGVALFAGRRRGRRRA